MNILITGISGFVGQHLAYHIAKRKNTSLYGIGLKIKPFSIFDTLNKKVKMFECDITNPVQVDKIIKFIKPSEVYHLAGFSSASGKDKKLIYDINVNGTLNILNALQKYSPDAKILLVSSSYVYGDTVKPARETQKTAPHGLYATSKLAMEQEAIIKFPQLDIMIARPVNHTGVGQEMGFVVPDFTQQIIANTNGIINVGNLSAYREFLNVSDVVKAYTLIIKKGKKNEIYNIGSSKPITIKKLLEHIIKLSDKKIIVKIDSKKFKPVDIKKNTLDAKKLNSLGWKIHYTLDDSLRQVFSYSKKKYENRD